MNVTGQLAKLESKFFLSLVFWAGFLLINDTHSKYIWQNCWDLVSMNAQACLLEDMLLLLALSFCSWRTEDQLWVAWYDIHLSLALRVQEKALQENTEIESTV